MSLPHYAFLVKANQNELNCAIILIVPLRLYNIIIVPGQERLFRPAYYIEEKYTLQLLELN